MRCLGYVLARYTQIDNESVHGVQWCTGYNGAQARPKYSDTVDSASVAAGGAAEEAPKQEEKYDDQPVPMPATTSYNQRCVFW